ncbi:MAG: protein kinase [Bryobacterales bacterium]|nr:protein kinase [Bryobacterales bacterium]
MGAVYLAAQEKPIRRNVALKVIKVGMDSAGVLARFNRERQALALMNHSSIARILDAGTAADGRPYFVMEYVEGVAITRYCDLQRYSVSKRLNLFLSVCRALHHAHEKGVIHRDIKPSNVLVAEQDGQPVPKVIDFGIAKAAGRLEDTLLTQFGQMIGTPQYASPEQADLAGGEVGPASDVYSLGVLLYELLVGSVPFDQARLGQAGLSDMLRIIREEDPPSLRSRLTEPDTDTGAVAASRDTDPAALRKLVSGDLERVTRKALEKPPLRRYSSVAEFATDVERFLAGQSVLASAPDIRYRTATFFRRHRVGAAVCAATVLAFTAGWFGFHRRAPSLTARDTIVLADFGNSTGDAAFDDTLRLSLTMQLAQSPFLSIQPDGRIRQTMRQMKQPPDARLNQDVAREVCERLGSAAVVEGSIGRMGSQYALNLSMRACQTGELLDSRQGLAARKEDVLAVLAGMAKDLRSKAGESLAMVEKHSAPIAEATTASLDALKAFSAGRRVWAREGPQQAIPHYQRAVQIDPGFAMAYADLGVMYGELDEFEAAAANVAKAYALRERVTDSERLQLALQYERSVTGDLEKARLAAELWAETYPRAPQPRGYLSGTMTAIFGRYEDTASHARKAIQLDPDFGIAYFHLSRSYLKMGKYREAEEVVTRALQRGIDNQEILLQQYDLAFLRRDDAAMQAVLARSQLKPDARQLIMLHHAMTLACQGRLASARNNVDQVISAAQRGRYRQRVAEARSVEAVWESFAGNAAAARRAAAAALSPFSGREVRYGAALALAMAGDSTAARTLTNELAKGYPEDTYVQLQYLPVLRAQLALDAGQPAEAIEALAKARPTEMGTVRAAVGELYPIYFRGLAHMAAHRAREAAQDFQRILDHPAAFINDPVGPATRLQLARALNAAGDKARARAAYRELIELWRDADAAMPVLVQAKAEAGRL